MFKLVIHQMTQRDWVWLFVMSAIIAACGVFGVSYVVGEGWALLPWWLALVLIIVGTFLVAGITFLLDVAFTKFDKESGSKSQREFERLLPKWSVASIAIFSLIMLALWLPWYVANFPGGAYWDTYYQIFQVYPEHHPIAIIPWGDAYDRTLTDAWLVDHHPVLVTMIYGLFGWASDQLTGTWMTGVAIFTAIAGILHCIAFTSSVAYLRRIGVSPALCFAAYLFFALMPFVPTWAMCMVKDSFFGLFYVPYFMMMIETVRTRGKFLTKRSHVVWFVVLALILCLTKKQGIFMVVITAAVGWFAFWWRGRRAASLVKAQVAPEGAASATTATTAEPVAVEPGDAAQPAETPEEKVVAAKAARRTFLAQALASLLAIAVVLPLIVFPLLNIQQGGRQEILGPLFQQTARYIVEHPDEVTDEEKEAISAVLDYDKIKDGYVFNFQDSVKYRYNLDATTEDLLRYLQVYVQQGMKDPEAYFAAFMSLAGYYVAPTAVINIRMTTVDTYIGENDERHMLWNPTELYNMRTGLDQLYNAVGEWAIINLPLLIVTYTLWLPALLIYVCQRRRMGGRRKLEVAEELEGTRSARTLAVTADNALDGYAWVLLLVPQLVLIAFCIISPVYDGRYVIPIFDVAPLMYCGICLLLKRRDHSLDADSERAFYAAKLGVSSSASAGKSADKKQAKAKPKAKAAAAPADKASSSKRPSKKERG